MKRASLWAVVCALSIALAASADSMADTLELPDAELGWSDSRAAGLVSDAGVFAIERTERANERMTLRMTVVPTNAALPEMVVTGIRLDDVVAENQVGRGWTGQMDGESVSGTLRVYSEDIESGDVCFHWQATNGDDKVVLDVVVTTDTEAAHQVTEAFGSLAVWPWKAYCGCDGLNTLCAHEPLDCQLHAACPSGSGDTCHWYIIFDPWYACSMLEPLP